MQTHVLLPIASVPLDQYPQNFCNRVFKVQSSLPIKFVEIGRVDPKLQAYEIMHAVDTPLCRESDIF